jgi:hypothetical protein
VRWSCSWQTTHCERLRRAKRTRAGKMPARCRQDAGKMPALHSLWQRVRWGETLVLGVHAIVLCPGRLRPVGTPPICPGRLRPGATKPSLGHTSFALR